MKIHFDNVSLNQSTGPSTFARRLATEFVELGHEVWTTQGNKADVSLVFIEHSGAPLASKIIQRLDGFWFKPDDFINKNTKILALYRQAHGVVFQSDFDRQFIKTHWGLPTRHTVILNGIKKMPITKFSSPTLEQIRQQYKLVFVASANWHKQKRLQSNIDMFQHIRKTIEPRSCLMVLGSNPDVLVADKDVFYAGSLPEQLCLEIYSMADWLLCLEWLPHCPNVVVECLSQNTPVICSEYGGINELAAGFCISLKEKQQFCFELNDYDKPPLIDVTQIQSLPNKHMFKTQTFSQLDIKNTAQAYLSFMQQ